jgi:hypothetical protein
MNETKTDMSTAVVIGRFVWVATLIGPGMHPDTSGADYESLPDELTPKMIDDAIADVDDLGLDASELLNEVFEPWLRHYFPEGDAPRTVGTIEARCTKCGQTFIPADKDDLIHLTNMETGTDCGGRGVILGHWQ